MFLSKSDSVKPIWYPLRLFSLIPFHTTRMALPTNDVADIHYSNKKNNLKPVIEPSDLACSYSQLKTLILVLIWSYWFKYFTIVWFFKKESMVMFMFFFFFFFFLGGGWYFEVARKTCQSHLTHHGVLISVEHPPVHRVEKLHSLLYVDELK